MGSFTQFYRGAFFNAIVLGLVSFTQPGIWTALSNLGAGGLASPFSVNAANAITFGIMTVMSPIFGVLGNRWSLKWLLVFGTIGYVPYSAALYCNSVYGTQWFLLFGAATCGFSAAALWVSEAAIGVAYPEEHRRGLYIGIWFALNKIGSIIGTSVQLALNLNIDHKGSINPTTYLVLIALQCLGLPLSLLISPIDKLIRTDGTKPIKPPATTIAQGFRGLWEVTKRPEIALLVPIFLTSQWAQTYEGNYLADYFTVRARAVAAFIITIVGLAVNLIVGWVLDSNIIPRRSTRARATWVFIFISYAASFIYNLVLQVEFQKDARTFDIDTPGFGRAVGVYIVYFSIGYQAFGVWAYWVLGSLAEDIQSITFSTSLLRSGESLSSTISYALGSSEDISLLTNLIVSAVLFFVAVPTTTWSVWKVQDSVAGEAGDDIEGNTVASFDGTGKQLKDGSRVHSTQVVGTQ